jgi:Tfp pilus assembly protein PilX
MIKIVKNKKGNALITAIITYSVLLLIAVGTVTLSLSNVTVSSGIKEHNNAYYVSEAAVQKGLQIIKDKTAAYYEKMRLDGYSAYEDNYDNFYTNVLTNVRSAFSEPSFSENAYENASTATTFTKQDIDSNNANMVVESTSTFADGTKRTVRGIIKLTRQPLFDSGGSGGSSSFNPSKSVLTVGGNFVFNASTSPTQIFYVNNGGAEVGGYTNKNNANKYIKINTSGYAATVTPGLGNSIADPLTYSALFAKKKSTITRYVTASTPPTWSDQGSKTDLHYLEGVAGLSFSLSSGSYYGQVYCRGNLTITNGNYYGNVFCDGNVNLSSAQVIGNIVAAGNINISGGTYGGTVVSGVLQDGVFFAGGDINLNNGGTLVRALAYAKGDFNMNSNPSGTAVIFAGDDINVTVSNTFAYTGTMMCKGDFVLQSSSSCWHQLTNDSSFAAAAAQNDWLKTYYTSEPKLLTIDGNSLFNKDQIYEK